MGLSRQEYWSGLPCPALGDLPDPGIELTSLALAGRFFTTSATWKVPLKQSLCVLKARSDQDQDHVASKELCARMLSHGQLSATPWTVACQAPLSMGLSRQEYWSGLLFLLQRIFLTQGLNPGLLHCRQILYHLSYRENPLG